MCQKTGLLANSIRSSTNRRGIAIPNRKARYDFFSFHLASLRGILLSFSVLKLRTFVIYWLPVIIWMSLIFTVSGNAGSFQHSSRILGPLLRWLFPSMSHETQDVIIFGIRKCAHLTEYAILAFLVWHAWRKPRWHDPRPWMWSHAGVAIWVAMFYATTDEFHQTFVPSREGCVRDVLIDSTGAVAGMIVLWLLGRVFKLW